MQGETTTGTASFVRGPTADRQIMVAIAKCNAIARARFGAAIHQELSDPKWFVMVEDAGHNEYEGTSRNPAAAPSAKIEFSKSI